MEGKIRANKDLLAEDIKAQEFKEEEEIRFCFKHFKPQKSNFRLNDCEVGFFQNMLGTLKEVSRLRASELLGSHSDALKTHIIDWNDTSEPEGFGLHEQLGDERALQISLGENSGRIHGFFVQNIYFIVWLDPEHNLY
jgi:hypothetical protein